MRQAWRNGRSRIGRVCRWYSRLAAPEAGASGGGSDKMRPGRQVRGRGLLLGGKFSKVVAAWPSKTSPHHPRACSCYSARWRADASGHAYLFTGDSLEELEVMARTLAKALNCLDPVKTAGVATDCCDECVNCRQDRWRHPCRCALGAGGIQVAHHHHRPDARPDAADPAQAHGGRLQDRRHRRGRPPECAGGQCLFENAGGTAAQVGAGAAFHGAVPDFGNDFIALPAAEFFRRGVRVRFPPTSRTGCSNSVPPRRWSRRACSDAIVYWIRCCNA